MGTLLKILFGLIALVFIIPLLWIVIKEIWFFFGFNFCVFDFGFMADVLIVLLIIFVIIWLVENLC